MIKVCKVGIKSCLKLLLFRNKATMSIPARYKNINNQDCFVKT